MYATEDGTKGTVNHIFHRLVACFRDAKGAHKWTTGHETFRQEGEEHQRDTTVLNRTLKFSLQGRWISERYDRAWREVKLSVIRTMPSQQQWVSERNLYAQHKLKLSVGKKMSSRVQQTLKRCKRTQHSLNFFVKKTSLSRKRWSLEKYNYAQHVNSYTIIGTRYPVRIHFGTTSSHGRKIVERYNSS